MIKVTEYRIDHPDIDPKDCLRVIWCEGKTPSISIMNGDGQTVDILLSEWDHVVEAGYKLLEENK